MNSKLDKNEIGLSGIGVSPEVLFNPCLTPIEQKVFGFIQILSKSRRGCFATNTYLAQMMMGYSLQTISNSISKLKKFLYVKVKIKKTPYGTDRRIFINEEYHIIYRPLVEAGHDFLDFIRNDEADTDIYALKYHLYSTIKSIIEHYNIDYNINKEHYSAYIDKNSNKNSNKIFLNKFKKNNDFSSEKSERSSWKGKSRKAKIKTKQDSSIYQNTSSKQRKSKSVSNENSIKSNLNKNTPSIIRTWSKAPNTTKHRIDPNNKTYQTIAKYISQLIEGTFVQKNKLLPKWVESNKIPAEFLNGKKWSINEIKEIVQNGTNYSVNGYWPPKKTNWTKNLSTFIYSAQSNSSWFLKCATDPPRLIAEVGLVTVQDLKALSEDEHIRELQKIILEYIDENSTKEFNPPRFEKAVRDLKAKQEKIIFYDHDTKYDLGDIWSFLHKYGEYLQKYKQNINPSNIGPNYGAYKGFIGFLRNIYGSENFEVDYKPSKESELTEEEEKEQEERYAKEAQQKKEQENKKLAQLI